MGTVQSNELMMPCCPRDAFGCSLVLLGHSAPGSDQHRAQYIPDYPNMLQKACFQFSLSAETVVKAGYSVH